jgi:hypothetical protein
MRSRRGSRVRAPHQREVDVTETSKRWRLPAPFNEDYRRSTRTFQQLDLPKTFTLHDLHAAVETHTGRTIHLIARPMPVPGPSGMWVAHGNDGYIFYPHDAPPALKVVVIGHELAHVLFDPEPEITLLDLATLLLPDIEPLAISRLGARTAFDAARERRAETFGSAVAERMGGWADIPLPTTADPAVLAQLIAVLEAAQHAP